MQIHFVGWHQPNSGASGCGSFDYCMIAITRLLKRRSHFTVKEWMLDCGFSQLLSGKGYISTRQYAKLIKHWSFCGTLLAAGSQDFLCTDAALKATGLDVLQHQKLTIHRYDRLQQLLIKNSEEYAYLQYGLDADGIAADEWLNGVEECQELGEMAIESDVYLMPIVHGVTTENYLSHLEMYGDRLPTNAWVGVGSLKAKTPEQVEAILLAIHTQRSDLRLHGFGLTKKYLGRSLVWDLLYSADTQAHGKAAGRGSSVYVSSNEPKIASEYAKSIWDSAPLQLTIFNRGIDS